jgi:mxaL protein
MPLKNRGLDSRLILLVLAALALAPVFARPSISASQAILNYLFVVDITQSMNVRDYTINDQPIDRLNYVKLVLIKAIHELPCGSAAGLGLFTGWQTTVLFNPIEVCHNRREVDNVIRHIDWRMTWAPQSNVARGVQDALGKRVIRKHRASLVFFTDGDEAPPSGLTGLQARRRLSHGKPQGLLVGVGDLHPSAVPLINQWGQMGGYFQSNGQPYLSSLKQNYLRKLGRALGLDYQQLQTDKQLLSNLRSNRYAKLRPARRTISWGFGAVALSLLIAVYLLDAPLQRKRAQTGA